MSQTTDADQPGSAESGVSLWGRILGGAASAKHVFGER
jgi:hypothetical protein